MARFSNLTSKK